MMKILIGVINEVKVQTFHIIGWVWYSVLYIDNVLPSEIIKDVYLNKFVPIIANYSYLSKTFFDIEWFPTLEMPLIWNHLFCLNELLYFSFGKFQPVQISNCLFASHQNHHEYQGLKWISNNTGPSLVGSTSNNSVNPGSYYTLVLYKLVKVQSIYLHKTISQFSKEVLKES